MMRSALPTALIDVVVHMRLRTTHLPRQGGIELKSLNCPLPLAPCKAVAY